MFSLTSWGGRCDCRKLSREARTVRVLCCDVMVVLASRVELVEKADGAGEQRQHWRSSRQHCSGLASKAAEWWGELQQSTREHGRCLTLSYRADNAIVWGASPASRLLVPPRRPLGPNIHPTLSLLTNPSKHSLGQYLQPSCGKSLTNNRFT